MAAREEPGKRKAESALLRWYTQGVAQVRLKHGQTRLAELHGYEAHGIGRRKMKIKRFLD